MISNSVSGSFKKSCPPVDSTTVTQNKNKKLKSRHRKARKVTTPSEAVVKIPTSKTEASTNWKLLLSKKSAEISAKKAGSVRPVKPQFLRRDVKKHKKQMEQKQSGEGSGTSSSLTTDSSVSNAAALEQAIKSTDKMHITIPSTGSCSSTEGETRVAPMKQKDGHVSFPKLTGLNSLGCFDYTHYGHLKTPVSPEHEFLTRPTPALAIDCEMVGVGTLKEDALARVSIVNEFGYCLYDKFVKPKLPVTDYRTEFSGVREEDLKNAEDFLKCLQSVAELIKGRTLIGHSLKSDFDVLLLKHPKAKIRDTSFYYRKKFKRLKTPSLKSLVKDHLKVEIQKGEHNSITDAQAAMKLYLIARDEWETSCSDKYNYRVHQYWMGKEYRKAFQAMGFVIQIKKKERK